MATDPGTAEGRDRRVPSLPDDAESSELFRAVVETGQDAIGVSRKGRHWYVNPAWVRMFGYDHAEEILGRPMIDNVHPDDRPEVLAADQRRRDGTGGPAAQQVRGLRRDGTSFDIDVRVSPWRYRGDPCDLVILRDVSSHRETERHLRESQAFYQALFDGNAAVKILVDPESHLIVRANRAAVDFYGYPEDVLTGMPIWGLNMAPPAEVRAAVREVRGGERQQFLARHRLASGEIRTMEVFSGPVVIGGRPLLLSILHDVTERQRLEDRLAAAQRAEGVSRLAGGIAHDFNNLLAVLMASAEILSAELGDLPRQQAHAATILRTAERAGRMTRQLLALSRTPLVEAHPIDVRDVVRDVAMFLTESPIHQAPAELHLGPEPAIVRGDPVQIEQVLLNLAQNAQDAMGPSGRLALSVDRQGADVVLTVRDEGPGMSGDVQAKIFDPFFTTKDRRAHSGLGLATVRAIVEHLGGRILVESERGRGTTFRVALPTVDAAPVVVHDGDARPLPPPGRRILLVEDEPDLRAAVTARLQLEGFAVTSADGAEQAMALLDGGLRPDVVVTDIVMPGIDGIALGAWIRARYPQMPLVYASGNADVVDASAEALQGAPFLQKPFAGARLVQAVEDAIRMKRG